MTSGNHLLLIDPQNDFADAKTGALAVPGADSDMNRTAEFIRRKLNFLDAIHVTLDSHQLYHIANPLYWMNDNGDRPAPFSHITAKDVENKTWTPTVQSRQVVLNYLRQLELNGRYEHTIWPPHCITGEWGHGIFPVITDALRSWIQEGVTQKDNPVLDYVLKGRNTDTEHFSAIRAEVPNSDPATHLNDSLIHSLNQANRIYVAGIAGSHCVANTVRDLLTYMNKNSAAKLVILKDTISPVPGCEKMMSDFLDEVVAAGAQVATTE